MARGRRAAALRARWAIGGALAVVGCTLSPLPDLPYADDGIDMGSGGFASAAGGRPAGGGTGGQSLPTGGTHAGGGGGDSAGGASVGGGAFGGEAGAPSPGADSGGGVH